MLGHHSSNDERHLGSYQIGRICSPNRVQHDIRDLNHIQQITDESCYENIAHNDDQSSLETSSLMVFDSGYLQTDGDTSPDNWWCR